MACEYLDIETELSDEAWLILEQFDETEFVKCLNLGCDVIFKIGVGFVAASALTSLTRTILESDSDLRAIFVDTGKVSS
jgi:hypothetical protein